VVAREKLRILFPFFAISHNISSVVGTPAFCVCASSCDLGDFVTGLTEFQLTGLDLI